MKKTISIQHSKNALPTLVVMEFFSNFLNHQAAYRMFPTYEKEKWDSWHLENDTNMDTETLYLYDLEIILPFKKATNRIVLTASQFAAITTAIKQEVEEFSKTAMTLSYKEWYESGLSE